MYLYPSAHRNVPFPSSKSFLPGKLSDKEKEEKVLYAYLVHSSIFVAIRVGVGATTVFFVLFIVPLGGQTWWINDGNVKIRDF